MPIKGVTEITRLPRLGKLHLGIKVKSSGGKDIPRATDYLVVPKEVQAVFGEKPKELRIMFPIDDDEMVAQQWYRAYSQTRGLICKGDGETATQLTDMKTGAIATKDSPETEMREVTCQGEKCPQYEAKKCRRVMNLQFLLPDVPGVGVWQLDTGSFFSIVNINSNLKLIRGICGRISMIPLVLSLGPQEVAPDGKKKIVHILNLTVPFSLVQLQEWAQLPPAKAMLPPPDTSRPDLLFLDNGEEAEARVVDKAQAEKDTEELWGEQNSPPRQPEASDPPEPQTEGSTDEADSPPAKATVGEEMMRDAIEAKVEGLKAKGVTLPDWCNRIDALPVNKLEGALKWFEDK